MTSPFPPTIRRQPMSAADFHCDNVGQGMPLIRRYKNTQNPDSRNREPATVNGGIDSTAIRIARYVVPQIT